MASSHLLRLGTIKGKNGVLVALQHNKRTLQAEHGASANIEPTKAHLNYCLAGNDHPQAIAKHARALMFEADIETPRKNGVMAVEVVFSLPIDRHEQDTRPFFNDCLAWVKRNMRGELLSFDVHLDESAPHAHAVILPLIDGKMQGNSLIGGRGNLMRLINMFHVEVARHYGLSSSDRKRLNATDKQALERQVLARLKADPAMQSSVWACVRDAIHKDPLPYAQMLGIDKQHKRATSKKSFVQIMTSKGKGPANDSTNAI